MGRLVAVRSSYCRNSQVEKVSRSGVTGQVASATRRSWVSKRTWWERTIVGDISSLLFVAHDSSVCRSRGMDDMAKLAMAESAPGNLEVGLDLRVSSKVSLASAEQPEGSSRSSMANLLLPVAAAPDRASRDASHRSRTGPLVRLTCGRTRCTSGPPAAEGFDGHEGGATSRSRSMHGASSGYTCWAATQP